MTLQSDAAERPLDISAMFATFARHGVAYVVIGGVAVQVHGHRRTTKDLDVLPAPEPANYERLGAALEELEARQYGLGAEEVPLPVSDPERLRTAAIVPPLMTRHGELHILNEVKGAAAYEALRERALVLELDGTEVVIAGLDDLIRMKRASGRPEDLADIAALTAIERGEV